MIDLHCSFTNFERLSGTHMLVVVTLLMADLQCKISNNCVGCVLVAMIVGQDQQVSDYLSNHFHY